MKIHHRSLNDYFVDRPVHIGKPMSIFREAEIRLEESVSKGFRVALRQLACILKSTLRSLAQ